MAGVVVVIATVAVFWLAFVIDRDADGNIACLLECQRDINGRALFERGAPILRFER